MNESTTFIKNESQSSISIRWGKSPDDVLKVYADSVEALAFKLDEAKDLIKVAHGLKGVEE
jgi:hypothetical protein